MNAFAKLLPTLALVAAFAPAPAAHATIVGQFLASGTISPGLTMIPTFQHYTMRWSFMSGASTNSGTVTASGCEFVGNSDGPDTNLASAFTGTIGGCTSGDVTGTMTFSRQAAVMTYTASITINGEHFAVRAHGGGQCLYTQTTVRTHDSYIVVCDLVQ